MNRTYHVAVTGKDSWEGSRKRPLRTISKATQRTQSKKSNCIRSGTGRTGYHKRFRADSELGTGRGNCVEKCSSQCVFWGI